MSMEDSNVFLDETTGTVSMDGSSTAVASSTKHLQILIEYPDGVHIKYRYKYTNCTHFIHYTGSISKRSWSVYNLFLTAIYATIKCEDDISFCYQLADSSQSKALCRWWSVMLKTLKQLVIIIILIICCFKV